MCMAVGINHRWCRWIFLKFAVQWKPHGSDLYWPFAMGILSLFKFSCKAGQPIIYRTPQCGQEVAFVKIHYQNKVHKIGYVKQDFICSLFKLLLGDKPILLNETTFHWLISFTIKPIHNHARFWYFLLLAIGRNKLTIKQMSRVHSVGSSSRISTEHSLLSGR